MTKIQKQSGVSLMLAVLVLSAITAIAFSFTTIIFIELRSAGDVIRGEPALYATLGLTEEALFQYKRYVNGADGTANIMDVTTCSPKNTRSILYDICYLGGVNMQSPAPELLTLDDVPKLITVYPNSSVTIPMYDPYSYELQYGKAEVTLVPHLNSGKIEMMITGTDIDLNQDNPYNGSFSDTDGVQSISNFQNGYQYEMQLTNNTSSSFLVNVVTYDTNATDTKGLPLVGQRALDIVANYLGINRTYRVYIPVP